MTDPHLDDESLSAALDGQDAPGAAHVAGCAACRARSDSLATVRRAVAADPGAAPVGLADRAVAAALSAYAAERAASSSSSPTVVPGDGGVVVPLRPPPGRARRVPGWALGVAAALAAVLVAVPVLTRDTRDDAQETAAAARDDSAPSSKGAGAAPVVDGGDLGEQSDQLALGGVLAGAVTGGGNTTAATERGGGGASAPGAGAGTPEVAGVEAAPTTPAAATASPAPSSPDAFSAPPGAPPTTASPGAIAACEDTVRSEFATGLGPLLYRATLRWQGTRAVLLAYRLADTSGNGPDHRAFVMALDGCRLLVVQGF